MRNPHRWRTIALAFFVSGIVATALPFLLPEAAAGDTARGILFIYGVMALLFGGGTALFRHVDVRAGMFHGKGDGTDPEDLSKCYSCGYETHRFVSHCPRCGTTMQSRRWSRRFGWVLLVCGLIITSMIGATLYYTAPTLLRPGVDVDGARFLGSAGQALFVLGILSVVFTFGATVLAYGLWQIKTGRRSKNVIYFTVGLFTVLAFIAVLI